MRRSRRVGLVIVVLGLLLCVLAFGYSGSTQRACPGLESVAYDTVGVDPGGFEVTSVDRSTMELAWYDGCNWRSSSLVPLLAGLASLGLGLAFVSLGVSRGGSTA